MRFGIFLLALFVWVQGCGVLMGSPYLREEEEVVAVREGRFEPAGVTYAAAATAAFHPARVEIVANLLLTQIQHCRRYDEIELSVRGGEGRAIATPGLVLDTGVLAAGLVGSLIVPQPAVKGAFILGAAIPLAVDGIAAIDKTGRPPETRLEKRYESAGTAPCETRPTQEPVLVLQGATIAATGETYRIVLPETYLMAHGTTEAVNLNLMVAADATAPAQPLKLALWPGREYQAYTIARLEVERFATPTRVARFVSDYPRAAINEKLRRGLIAMLPAARDAAELQAVLAMENLDAEIRKVVRARFTELRTQALLAEIPQKLSLAVAAEQSANTFLLNGFPEEGRRRLEEKNVLVAEACRAFAELDVRETRSRAELIAEIQTKLASDVVVALAWLRACP